MIEMNYRRNGDCASVACTIAVAQEGNFYIKGEAWTGNDGIIGEV